MRNFLIYIIAIPIISSCNDISFEIKNNSKFPIDSLKIQANENNNDHYISLKSKESKKYILDMNNIIKVDGSYNLSYKINGIRKNYNFGYYTNGSPSETLIEVRIGDDTVTNKVIKN